MLPEHDDTPTANQDANGPEFSAPPLKPFTRKGSHAPSKPPAKPSNPAPVTPPYQTEPQRPRMPVGAPGPRPGSQTRNQAETRKLIVGGGIKLVGEISDCEALIVEGEVDVTLTGGRLIEVMPNGVFRGDVDVDEAFISGNFEGKLIVHSRLIVRSGGRVSGSVRYGNLTIEAGGEIVGDTGTLDTEVDTKK